MPTLDTDTVRLLLEQFAASLARTLENITGSRVQIDVALDSDGAPSPGGVWFEHRLDRGQDVLLWTVVPDDSSPIMQEALNQAVAGMASDLNAGGSIELRPEPGVRSSGPAVSAVRGSVNVLIEGSERLVVPAAFSLALASLVAEAQERSASPSNPTSATLDLLLDLELPVSVSFGTAQVTLQDALRYSAGSLIELERTVDDPVEIIVNDFVIARGEVVVVNGYYGVRIQQIASRRERLQTTGNLLAANGSAGPSKTPAHL